MSDKLDRAVRTRMEKTGEPYHVAFRAEVSAHPEKYPLRAPDLAVLENESHRPPARVYPNESHRAHFRLRRTP